MILGVDPGLTGACAVLDEHGELITVFDTPVIADDAHRRIDAASLADLIHRHGPYSFAVVEHATVLPGAGVSRMFKIGLNCDLILGAIAAIQIPIRQVASAKWKRAMGLTGDADGALSRAKASAAWPAHAALFTWKSHYRRADAALLGAYSLRNGGHDAD